LITLALSSKSSFRNPVSKILSLLYQLALTNMKDPTMICGGIVLQKNYDNVRPCRLM
jgi:hypothetical protein